MNSEQSSTFGILNITYRIYIHKLPTYYKYKFLFSFIHQCWLETFPASKSLLTIAVASRALQSPEPRSPCSGPWSWEPCGLRAWTRPVTTKRSNAPLGGSPAHGRRPGTGVGTTSHRLCGRSQGIERPGYSRINSRTQRGPQHLPRRVTAGFHEKQGT